MSLLLKALKQAEKSGAPAAEAPADLDLEPLTLATPKPRPQWVEPNEPQAPAAPRARLTLPRLGLVPTAALIALLVAVAYGVYVYRALHPVSFAAVPPPAPRVTQPPAQPAPPTSALPPSPAPQPLPKPAAAAMPSHKAAPPAAPQGHATPSSFRPRSRPAVPAMARSAPAVISATPSSLNAAYAAWRSGRLDEAQALYARAAAENAGVDAWLGLASIASLRGQTRQAAAYYEKALQLDPNNTVAQAALLDSLGSSDPAAAEAHLQELIHQQPSAFLYFALGNFYAGQQRWADAESAYFEASRRAPENADFAYNLAVSLDHLQQSAAALRYYREALKLAGPNTRFDPQAAQSRIAQLAGQ